MTDPGPGRWEIRSTSARDLAAIHALERDIFGSNAWSLPNLAAELVPETPPPHDDHRVMRHGVVAVEADEVVGYALSRRGDEICDIVRVAVALRIRRLGLGTALAEALMGFARDQGCTRALLEVDAGNVAAISCYRRLGFTLLDRRPRYYPDGADALVLQKVL